MVQVKRPSDSIGFPLEGIDRAIADLLPDMPKPPGNSAFHSIRHLNRAWRLREIDPEMAVLRSITAEEEAATALFLSLKRRRYDGADRLNHRNHVHKNAVIPFFEAVSRMLEPYADRLPPSHLYLDTLTTTPPRLLLGFQAVDPTTGELDWAYPQPPFNVKLTKGIVGAGEWPEDFSEAMAAIATEANAKSVLAFLEQRSNLRNTILYAAPSGIPAVTGDIESALRLYQGNVFSILKPYLMIDPYAEQQPFVQQALYGFLRVLNRLPPTEGT